jgi:hypothetical protein
MNNISRESPSYHPFSSSPRNGISLAEPNFSFAKVIAGFSGGDGPNWIYASQIFFIPAIRSLSKGMNSGKKWMHHAATGAG